MEGQNSTAGRSKISWEGQRWYRQRGATAAHYTHSQQQLCPRNPQSHSDVGSSPTHIWKRLFPGCLAVPDQGRQEESQGRALAFLSCSPQQEVPKQLELSVPGLAARPPFYSRSEEEDQLVKQACLGSLSGLYSNKPIRKWAKLQNKFLEDASTYFTGPSKLGHMFSTIQQSSVWYYRKYHGSKAVVLLCGCHGLTPAVW